MLRFPEWTLYMQEQNYGKLAECAAVSVVV